MNLVRDWWTWSKFFNKRLIIHIFSIKNAKKRYFFFEFALDWTFFWNLLVNCRQNRIYKPLICPIIKVSRWSPGWAMSSRTVSFEKKQPVFFFQFFFLIELILVKSKCLFWDYRYIHRILETGKLETGELEWDLGQTEEKLRVVSSDSESPYFSSMAIRELGRIEEKLTE